LSIRRVVKLGKIILKVIGFLRRYPRLFKLVRKVYIYFYLRYNSIKKIPKKLAFKLSQYKDPVERLLLKYPLVYSGMMTENQLRVILSNLKKVLDEQIEGDIVELGCNVGTTSIFIRQMLDLYGSKKVLHVYDSFEGLPEKSTEDLNPKKHHFKKGSCKTSKDVLIDNFNSVKLKLPEIHRGWFGNIPDKEYPSKIAFAFFDGDFYSSILDSFKKVYPKTAKGGRILVHDYKYDALPGVERACAKFLKDKPEKGSMKNKDFIGIMVKKG
jgi:O-methyltransferase